MKRRTVRIILAFLILVGASLPYGNYGANCVSAEVNESGTVTVIKSNGQVYKDYSNVRDAWDYCKKNSDCTIRLKTDLSISKQFKVSRGMKVTVDLYGHTINGNNNRCFEVTASGVLKVTSTAKNSDGTIIKGRIENCKALYGGAIRSRGVLEVDHVIFNKCVANGEPLSDGGAIAVWSYTVVFVTPTDPHAEIKDCEFFKCDAIIGGAVSVKYEKYMPPLSLASDSNGDNPTCTIKNSYFDGCTSMQGGAVYCNMTVALDRCDINSCSATDDGGAIIIPKRGKVILYKTDIHNCRANRNGGAISLCDYDGCDRSVLYMWDGSIQACAAGGKYGGGIDVPDNATVKLGGDVLINDNFLNKSGGESYQNNIDMYYKNPLQFYDEGLTDGANVHITSSRDKETYLGACSSAAIAQATASRIDVDQMGSNRSDDFDAYTKSNSSKEVYAGERRGGMSITKFVVKNHPEAKVSIMNGDSDATRRIVVELSMGSEEHIEWKALWQGAGTITSGCHDAGRTSEENPFSSFTAVASGETSKTDWLKIQRRKDSGTWQIYFKDIPKYNVTTAKETSSGRVDQTVQHKCAGTKISLTTPETYKGEHFQYWDVYGVSLTDAELKKETIEFTMPSHDVSAVAVYAKPASKPTCVITLNGTNGDNRYSNEDIVNTYEVGTEVRLTAKNPGGEGSGDYVFDQWEIVSAPPGVTIEGFETKKKQPTVYFRITEGMNADDMVFMAVYIPKHTVYSHNGAEYKETKYKEKELVSLTAADSKGGASFSHWEVDGIDLPLIERDSYLLEFEMPENNVTAVAVYQSPVAMPTCLVTINGTNKNARAGVEPSTEDYLNTYADNSTAVVKAVNPGLTKNNEDPESSEDPSDYKFNRWEVLSAPDGFALSSAEKKSETFEKELPSSADVVLKADYLKKYDVSAVNGTINGKSGTSRIFEGEKITVKADFMTSMHFLYWIADGVELTDAHKESESFEITMPNGDVQFVPVYEEGLIYPHNLKIVNGKIKKYGTESKFFESSLLEIEADTRAGYTFKKWEAVGIELDEDEMYSPKLSIHMPDNDVTLTATFTKNPDTGDNKNILLYVTVLLLSLLEIGLLVFKKHKMTR